MTPTSSSRVIGKAKSGLRPRAFGGIRWHARRGRVTLALTAAAMLAACGNSEGTSSTTSDSTAAEPTLSLTDTAQPPEDILPLEGTDWVLFSSITAGDHPGGMTLVNREESTESTLWPASGFKYELDPAAFPDCETPPDEARADTHGINAVQTGPGTFDLYVVYHGSRESIEVFEVDVSGTKPDATWRGCVVLPEGTAANSVVPLPDGGLALTNFTDPREPLLPQLFSGEPSGSVWTWKQAGGWAEVPGSQSFGPNGIEVSADGKTLYVAESMKKRVVSIPVEGGSLTEVATMDFLPDNLRWTESDTLLTTGMEYEPLTQESIQSCAMEGTGCVSGFVVVEIDPSDNSSEALYSTESEEFQYATVAAQVGADIWVGGNALSKVAVVSGLS